MTDLPLNINAWALQTIAMLLTALLIPKLKIDGPIPAFFTILVLSFVNAHLWSTALFLKIPDSVTAQALVLFVTNGVIFWVIVKVLPGIDCEGFLPALIAPLVFTGSMLVISRYGSDIDWNEIGKTVLRLMQDLKAYVNESAVVTPDR